MHQAQDTFVAVLKDGTERYVQKGEVLADGHELVRRDKAASDDNPSRIPLFRPLDLGEEEQPQPKPVAKPKAQAQPAQKPAAAARTREA